KASPLHGGPLLVGRDLFLKRLPSPCPRRPHRGKPATAASRDFGLVGAIAENGHGKAYAAPLRKAVSSFRTTGCGPGWRCYRLHVGFRVERGAQGVASKVAGLQSASELKGLRVLVVEDSWHVANALKSLLEELGVEVAGPAATLQDAERLLETRAPQVAVVD